MSFVITYTHQLCLVKFVMELTMKNYTYGSLVFIKQKHTQGINLREGIFFPVTPSWGFPPLDTLLCTSYKITATFNSLLIGIKAHLLHVQLTVYLKLLQNNGRKKF